MDTDSMDEKIKQLIDLVENFPNAKEYSDNLDDYKVTIENWEIMYKIEEIIIGVTKHYFYNNDTINSFSIKSYTDKYKSLDELISKAKQEEYKFMKSLVPISLREFPKELSQEYQSKYEGILKKIYSLWTNSN